MKEQSVKEYGIRGLLKAGVHFLLFVFLLIPVTEALHAPHDVFVIKEKPGKEISVHSYSESCPICDFVINQQSKHLDALHLLEFNVYYGAAQVLPDADSPVSLERPFLSWTNKGPPSLI